MKYTVEYITQRNNMAKIKRYTEEDGGYQGQLGFMCPGCGCRHWINDKETAVSNLPDGHIWYFNGDFDKPTIRASVLTRIYIFNPETNKWDREDKRCHSFITDGMIQFLGDCQHNLAGQTVELPDM